MKELLISRKKGFTLYLIASIFPIVMQVIVTFIFVGIVSTVDVGTKSYFYKIVTLAIVGILLEGILYISSRLMRIGFMRDILLDIRQKAFDKVIHASYHQFAEKSKEVYLSHLTNDINTFENNFFLNLLNVIFLIGLVSVSWLIVCILDPTLGAVVGLGCVVILVLSRRFLKKTEQLQKDVSDRNEEMTVGMFNMLEGIEILKLNNVDKQSALRFLKQAKDVEEKKFKFNVYSVKQEKIMQSIGYLTFVLTVGYVCFSYSEATSLAVATLKIMLVQRSVFSLAQVLPRFNIMMSSVGIYHKIVEETEALAQEEGIEAFEFMENIRLEDIAVTYDDRVVLEHITLTIEKGKKYLIKGASGAGKSTLMKVLARNRIADGGKISVDGVNYEAINSRSFNEQTALIHQEVFLFEDTIRNNITLYQPYSEEAIQDAVVRSGLSDVIKDGITLDTVLEENGKNLSGGQKQRIAIARALIKDVQVLFVDEATSALDAKTGSQIESQLIDLPCTVVVISHRYYEGITDNYDYVLEVREGQVIQHTAKAYYGEVLVC